jgi:two-component system nitrogen regulation sensor histidine kinase NtrY
VIAPIVLLAILSGLLLHFGMGVWFDEKVQRALRESEDVAQVYLEEHRKITREGVSMMANYIQENLPKFGKQEGFFSSPMSLEDFLTVQSRLFFLTEAVLVSESRHVIGRSHFSFPIEFAVSHELLERSKKGVVLESSLQNERLIAVQQIPHNPDVYLIVSRKISQKVIDSIQANREAWASYRELLQNRWYFLKYCLTIFTLLSAVALLLAIWRGVYFSRQMLRPIYRLIEAAKQIQQGDLHARVGIDKTDKIQELRTLGKTFNQMLDEITVQQKELHTAHGELERRHRFTKNVLEGISSGVIGLDEKGRVHLANDRAYELLKSSPPELLGQDLATLFPEWAPLLACSGQEEAQILTTSCNLYRTLRIHTTGKERLEGEETTEQVITFEDLTEFLAIQRQAAWSDVARRVAHEIKNPLTPIQLSAERLKRRYLPQIEDEPETFQKCVETIIRQVEAIGRIILEFSSFARLPKASLAEVDLVPVVESVFCLYREAYPHIQWDYCAPPTLACWCDAQQIEQVVTNLLKNATESLHEKSVQARGHKGSVGVLLVVHNAFVTLEVSDNGCGLPSEMTRRFAEPYWTTKATGTGLGLAIVKKIAEDHGGELDLRASPEGGAVARVTLQSSPRQEQSPRGQTIQRQTI